MAKGNPEPSNSRNAEACVVFRNIAYNFSFSQEFGKFSCAIYTYIETVTQYCNTSEKMITQTVFQIFHAIKIWFFKIDTKNWYQLKRLYRRRKYNTNFQYRVFSIQYGWVISPIVVQSMSHYTRFGRNIRKCMIRRCAICVAKKGRDIENLLKRKSFVLYLHKLIFVDINK